MAEGGRSFCLSFRLLRCVVVVSRMKRLGREMMLLPSVSSLSALDNSGGGTVRLESLFHLLER
jgi:hypothetical protein